MLKIFFKYFIKDKIKLTLFNRLVIFRLLRKALKKDQLPESYLYEYSAKTIQKTLKLMHKKQGTIDSMWLQRGLIIENKSFKDNANGSSTILRQNKGKNYLSDNDLDLLEKIDPVKTTIIKKTHQKLEDIYKKALLNHNLIYQPSELAKIGKILNLGLNSNPNLTFHRGSIYKSTKLYFKRIGEGFKNIGKTGIFVFDEKIDLLFKGEEFIFNPKTASKIQRKVGGKFYMLNPLFKKFVQPRINNILNTGVYDLPHLGHASKIKSLKKLLDKKGKLIIGLTSNKNVSKLKNKQVIFSAQNRKIMLESLNYANKIIIEPKQSQIFKTFYK